MTRSTLNLIFMTVVVVVVWIGMAFVIRPGSHHDRRHRAEAELMGWVEEAVGPLKAWRASQPPFQIVDAAGNPVQQDNSKLDVRLFELKRLANGGELVNGPQLTGDCTSWATEHAIETTLAGQFVADGTPFQRVFPTFSYAVGRVEIWKPTLASRMPPEGCSVAAVLKGAQQRGFVSWEEAKSLGYEYSGQLADAWGRTGPPKPLYPVAEKHKVLTFSQMQSADDVRDAICNGYGVPFGSDFTWKTHKVIDGRIVAIDCTQSTPVLNRCGHAMCCDGYDGSTPNGPFFHIQNSWYPNSHPAPIDGSPVCGFWIDRAAMGYIVSKEDCFAISATQGFVQQSMQLFPGVQSRPFIVPKRDPKKPPLGCPGERNNALAP